METLLQTGYRKIIFCYDMNRLMNKGDNEEDGINPEKSHAFTLALDQKITAGHFFADIFEGRARH